MIILEGLAIWLLTGAVAAYWLGGVMERRRDDLIGGRSAINAILPSALHDD